MRVTRAYMAGFGTAGSLVAGAAILFVLASAFVAFRGWPQVGGQASPAAVLVARPQLHAASSVQRQLIAATNVSPAAASHSASTRASHGTAGSHAPKQGSVGPGTKHGGSPVATVGNPHTGTTGVVGTPPASSNPNPPASGCSTHCGTPASSNPISTVVKGATGAVGGTLTAAGKAVGSTVSGIAGAVAGTVKGVSPGLAGAVNGAGAGVSGVVNKTAAAAGGVVNGAGQAVSGLLGGHH